MRQVSLIFFFLIMAFPESTKMGLDAIYYRCNQPQAYTIAEEETIILTPMEALDIVKEAHASNFEKNSLQDSQEDYYYKLVIADYYLVYEYTDDNTGNYLFHLYEFVIDDVDTGIGHAVTYGWFWVNPYTGERWTYP